MGTRGFQDFAANLNFGNDAGTPPTSPEPQGIGKHLAMFKFGGGSSSDSTADTPRGEEGASLMDKAMGSVSGLAGKAKGAMGRAKDMVEAPIISRQQWMTFFGLAGIGSFLIMLSFMFIPMVAIKPQKFALLFTLGSICFMSSFAALKGTQKYVTHLFAWERAHFTAGYFGTMVGTVWASMVAQSYLLTIVFSAGQVVALAYFLVSYIPGGSRALTWFGGTFCSMCASICGFKKGGGSPLPL